MRHKSLALSLLSLFPLLLLLALPAAALSADDDRHAGDDDGYEETARVARLSLIRGDVSLRRAGGDKWERAVLNVPLVEGDRLATGADARLEIQIDARNFVRVGEYATIEVVTLREEGVALSLVEGTATLRLARFEPGREYFELDAPGTTVAAEQRGLYRLDVAQNGGVRITVRGNGRARIYSQDSGFALRDGRAAELAARGGGTGELEWDFTDARSSDSWDSWIDERERHLAGRLRYDGRERYYDDSVWGAEELDAYGDWMHTRDYGYVWRPHQTTVSTYDDWAPYRYGHWSWLPHYGWTWVGDEPWGWAPYHYGRWVYVDGRWCWAPRGYVGYARRSWWRPALVAFVYVPSSYGENVCWYPLSYHHRDPRSNYWRRAVGSDRLRALRRDEIDHLRRTNPVYLRAVTKLPVRDFGNRATRGRAAEDELARKALSGEPVRGGLPIRPAGDGTAEGGRGRVASPRGGGSIARGEGGAGDGAPRRLAERPTGAAARRPGVALDDELRRTRVFNNREPVYDKGVKGTPRDSDGAGLNPRGGGGISNGGRPTGAVARPARPTFRPGGEGDGGARRVRPDRPADEGLPADPDSGNDKPDSARRPPAERGKGSGRDDNGNTSDENPRDDNRRDDNPRTERPARPSSGGDDRPARPTSRPDTKAERRESRPEPREERRESRPEPREERSAPREERSAPREERSAPSPPREERQAPPPREERQESPPPREERPSSPPPPREERSAPAREEKRPDPPREQSTSGRGKRDNR